MFISVGGWVHNVSLVSGRIGTIVFPCPLQPIFNQLVSGILTSSAAQLHFAFVSA